MGLSHVPYGATFGVPAILKNFEIDAQCDLKITSVVEIGNFVKEWRRL
jgi:hypothetical protein